MRASRAGPGKLGPCTPLVQSMLHVWELMGCVRWRRTCLSLIVGLCQVKKDVFVSDCWAVSGEEGRVCLWLMGCVRWRRTCLSLIDGLCQVKKDVFVSDWWAVTGKEGRVCLWLMGCVRWRRTCLSLIDGLCQVKKDVFVSDCWAVSGEEGRVCLWCSSIDRVPVELWLADVWSEHSTSCHGGE